jgi:hypothetical protein
MAPRAPGAAGAEEDGVTRAFPGSICRLLGRSGATAARRRPGLAVTAAAEGLGVSRNTMSMLVNGRLGISPEWRSGSLWASVAARKAG